MPFRNSFKTNEEYNKYYREYRKKNLVKMRTYNREYNSMRRAAGLDKTAEKWNKLHPKEANARFLVAYAVRCGRIKKTKCVKCGNKNSQAHHEDYDKPLEVIWLCPVCHKALHMKKDKKWAVYK